MIVAVLTLKVLHVSYVSWLALHYLSCFHRSVQRPKDSQINLLSIFGSLLLLWGAF